MSIQKELKAQFEDEFIRDWVNSEPDTTILFLGCSPNLLDLPIDCAKSDMNVIVVDDETEILNYLHAEAKKGELSLHVYRSDDFSNPDKYDYVIALDYVDQFRGQPGDKNPGMDAIFSLVRPLGTVILNYSAEFMAPIEVEKLVELQNLSYGFNIDENQEEDFNKLMESDGAQLLLLWLQRHKYIKIDDEIGYKILIGEMPNETDSDTSEGELEEITQEEPA